MSALRRTIAKLDRLAARAATRNPAGDPHVYADGHAVRVGDRVEIARGRRSGDVDFVAELTRTSLDWPAVNLRHGGLFGMDEIEFAGFRPTPRSARASPGASRAPPPSRNPVKHRRP